MQRTLFLKNRPLVTFQWTKYGQFSICKIHEEDFSFWPHLLQKNHEPQLIKEWISHRITPVGQKILKRIKAATKAEGILGKVALTKGLSLNDTFWIGKENENFAEVNLYENSFNEEIAALAFSSDTHKIINFDSRSPEYSSEGVMRKCWIKRDNIIYLMKADDWPNTGNYNQIFAEYFATQLAEVFNIPHVSYFLEQHTNHLNQPEIVSLCPIFTSTTQSFLAAKNFFLFHDISANDLLPSWLETPYYYDNLMRFYQQEFYEDMMIFDAIIGNQDRHLNNFGYLFDSDNCKLIQPNPLFDHGLSLLSGVLNRETMSLNECLNYSDRGAFLDFSIQIQYFIRERHVEKIERLKKYELKQHPKFKISEQALEKIQMYIQYRANQCLAHLKSSHSLYK